MRGCRRRSDAVDGCNGVCGAKEIAPFVDGSLLVFDVELGCAEGSFPGEPMLGVVGEAVPVWALFWAAFG